MDAGFAGSIAGCVSILSSSGSTQLAKLHSEVALSAEKHNHVGSLPQVNTLSRQKTCNPFLIFTLTHLARQKSGPSLGVGCWPTVAGEFKRAGFLDRRSECIAT